MINNKRGFTIIELLITITLTLSIVYGALYIPIQFFKEYNDYSAVSEKVIDINTLRATLTKDLYLPNIEKINESQLKINNNIYSFTETGVYREKLDKKIQLTETPFEYELTPSELTIYNENNQIKYSLNSLSLERGDSNVE
ncbi:MAG: prepilin-type N-terminal cleavage/methylation domain-containing protein [Erysipelotrichia bacterium]|nr:prepilin-type N-terminal cleavage/methylation domain-containing protein [Erysipelotrichia bacterium]